MKDGQNREILHFGQKKTKFTILDEKWPTDRISTICGAWGARPSQYFYFGAHPDTHLTIICMQNSSHVLECSFCVTKTQNHEWLGICPRPHIGKYNNIQKCYISLYRLGNQYIVYLPIKYRYLSTAGLNLDKILDEIGDFDGQKVTFWTAHLFSL